MVQISTKGEVLVVEGGTEGGEEGLPATRKDHRVPREGYHWGVIRSWAGTIERWRYERRMGN